MMCRNCGYDSIAIKKRLKHTVHLICTHCGQTYTRRLDSFIHDSQRKAFEDVKQSDLNNATLSRILNIAPATIKRWRDLIKLGL